MRDVFAKAVLTVLLLSATPLPASAQFWDFADWVERMSGPGFRGYQFQFPVACRFDEIGVKWFYCLPEYLDQGKEHQRRLLFAFRYGRFGSGDGPYSGSNDLMYVGVPENQQSILMQTFEGTVAWTVHRAFDVTWSGGFRSFSTPIPGVKTVNIATIDAPGGDVYPVALFCKPQEEWCRFFKVTFRSTWLLGTIAAEDFGATPSEAFSEARRENLASIGLSLDALLLADKIKNFLR